MNKLVRNFSDGGAWRALVREPMTWFVLLATGIFGYDAWLQEAQRADDSVASTVVSDTIRVDEQVISSLTEDFSYVEGRQPDPRELDAMVQGWIDEEVIFREALVRGMHRTDGRVRSQLVEKMRVLWGGVPNEPTEQQLRDYYEDNITSYQTDVQVSFQQVFFEELPEGPQRVVEQLRSGEEVQGDGYWMGDTLDDYPESIIRNTFGGSFYHSLVSAQPGKWIGPLESPRGYHYVRLSDISQPYAFPFEDIRRRVLSDYNRDVSLRRISDRTDEIRDQFRIVRETSDSE